MQTIPFYKMSGSGNDFIIIDNRAGVVPEDLVDEMIVKTCRRQLSIGADGFILIEKSDKADFKWRFYNSDGSQADMCGNGARCTARFALEQGIAKSPMTWETLVGILSAEVDGAVAKVNMPKPHDIRFDYSLMLDGERLPINSANTGVPHAVLFSDSIDNIEIVSLGRAIRYHSDYAPKGANVNFAAIDGENAIAVRTYERGVEDETLACGTGSIASALIASHKFGMTSPVSVRTRGGEILKVHFSKDGDDGFKDIYLEGKVRIVYKGEFGPEAWEY